MKNLVESLELSTSWAKEILYKSCGVAKRTSVRPSFGGQAATKLNSIINAGNQINFVDYQNALILATQMIQTTKHTKRTKLT